MTICFLDLLFTSTYTSHAMLHNLYIWYTDQVTIHIHSPDLADIFISDINAEITERSKAVPVRVAWIYKVGDCLFCYVAAALLN